MFFHNFKYRLKCIIRDKEIMFWTSLFPLILATLFNLALGNISSAEKFEKIDVAVITEGNYEGKENFLDFLKEVSENDKEEDNIFDVKYVSKSQGDELLDNNKVKGIIYFNDDIRVRVKKTGLDETILKAVIDEYMQTIRTVNNISEENPEIFYEKTIDEILVRESYLKEVRVGKEDSDNPMVYFYSLIAMTCFYGGFLGLKEMGELQANQSEKGARVNIAPIHKAKIFLSSILAATIVQMAVIFILLIYLMFIMNVEIGNDFGRILLLCLIGVLSGISFGTAIGATIKKKEGIKTGVLLGITMMLSFLSGMMVEQIKYIIADKVPILGSINPINLITDSFYALYYFETYERFNMNLILLGAFIIICNVVTYLSLRRQKYASL